MRASDSGVGVHFDTVAGRRYQLESSLDLAEWIEVGSARTGDGGEMVLENTEALGMRKFYRVIVAEW
jgi:hypothetical protein